MNKEKHITFAYRKINDDFYCVVLEKQNFNLFPRNYENKELSIIQSDKPFWNADSKELSLYGTNETMDKHPFFVPYNHFMLFSEIIDKLNSLYDKKQRVPVGGIYYFVSEDSNSLNVHFKIDKDETIDKKRFTRGNYFINREVAQQKLNIFLGLEDTSKPLELNQMQKIRAQMRKKSMQHISNTYDDKKHFHKVTYRDRVIKSFDNDFKNEFKLKYFNEMKQCDLKNYWNFVENYKFNQNKIEKEL